MSAQMVAPVTPAQDAKCRELRKQGWRFSVSGDTITAKNSRLNQEKISDSWDDVIAMAEKVPVKEINKADQELIKLGLLTDPQQVINELAELEETGWDLIRDDDGSYYLENDELGMRTKSGEVFTMYNAIRAARWMEKSEESGTTYDKWFRHIEVVNDPNHKKVIDMSDAEIVKAISLHEVANQEFAEVLRLELKLRDENFTNKSPANVPEKWFRKAPVPDDPHNRLVEDLSDKELTTLLEHWGENVAIGKAIKLEIALRKNEFQVENSEDAVAPMPEKSYTVYHQFRRDVADLSLIELLSDLEKAEQGTFEPRQLQALRDEANIRGGLSVDGNGVYDEVEGTDVLFLELPFVNARIALMSTSEMVGWIYSYSWQRGKIVGSKHLTARHAFDTRDEALKAAVEELQKENGDHGVYTGSVQAERAMQIYAWAESLLHPDEAAEQLEDNASLGLIEKDSAPVKASLFDYSLLDEETAVYAKERAVEIRFLLKRTVKDVIEVGVELAGVKVRLAGHFVQWCKFEFDMSERFARNAMSVAREFKDADVEGIPLKMLYELASPSTPEAARKEVIELKKVGTVTKETVKTVITRHKDIEESKSPTLPGIRPPAPVADDSTAKNEGVESDDDSSRHNIEGTNLYVDKAEAEVIATGRTENDLLALLKVTPLGMILDGIVARGFKESQVEKAVTSRKIEKRDLRYFYAWQPGDIADLIRERGPQTLMQLEEAGATKYAIECAKMDDVIKHNSKGVFVLLSEKDDEEKVPDTPPALNAALNIDELLKGRSLTVAFSFLPAMPGLATVGVRVGDNLPDTAFSTLPSSIVNSLPPEVIEMITEQAKTAAGKKIVKASTPAKSKAVAKKAGPPAKKAATPATKSTTPAKSVNKTASTKAKKRK